MKKKMVFLMYLSLQIIGIFGVIFLFTFINDKLNVTGIFGDYDGSKTGFAPDGHHWGGRHYCYAWCCFFLVVIGIVRLFMWWDWFWSYRNNKY